MNDFFDRLRRQVPWHTIASVIADNTGRPVAASEEIVEQLKNWGSHLTRNALEKWPAFLVAPRVCQVPHLRLGQMENCRATALFQCDSCGRNVCLAHARVDWQADATCEVCIGHVKKTARSDSGPGFGGGSKNEARAKGMSVAEARRVLRVRSDATWEEIKKRWKRLSYKYNADRPQSDAQRRKNTERLQEINEAYAVLRRQNEQAA